MARALKTFQAHLGFYDTVVAVPSQAAALKAWGSRQNLFRDGLAKPADDPAAIAAATAKPGVVLRRPAGSKAPFSENPGLPQVPNAPKKSRPIAAAKPPARPPQLRIVSEKPKPEKQPLPPKPPKPPDRSKLDAAERRVLKVKEEEQRALAALEKRKAALDEEEHRLRSEFRRRRDEADTALAAARKAYASALNRR
ncbi:MAG TPA: hypothetical protein VHT51_17520 [Micropepsaceae bacterium]|nr:hypothetical protein [Micropepsaceae bacterium]